MEIAGNNQSDELKPPLEDAIRNVFINPDSVDLDREPVDYQRVVFIEIALKNSLIDVTQYDFDFASLPIPNALKVWFAECAHKFLFMKTKPWDPDNDDGALIDFVLKCVDCDFSKLRNMCKGCSDFAADADDDQIKAETQRATKIIVDFLGHISFPSAFDVVFNGPTAVIVMTHIENLRFRPDESIIFNNSRDRIYYRNNNVRSDLKAIDFVNAYKASARHRRPKLFLDTPANQEHKIDYGMVVGNWGMPKKLTTERHTKQWLLTPFKIDPPHINPGGGG